MSDRSVVITRRDDMTYTVAIDGVEVARGLTLEEAVAFCVEDDGHEYCIFLEPMGEDNGSWFSQWIKHRDDLPQSTKDWLEAAGVEPGESVPMFTGGNAPVMRFKYKGMAEKTAEKIAEMYPQFEGKLHVQIYEEGPNNGPQE